MKIELTETQRTVLEIIKEKRHFGIFMDMGTGKTATILELIEYLVFDKLDTSNILIIAPATVANELEVWQDEIQKWDNYSYFDYTLLKGSPDKRKTMVKKNDASITIMSDALIDWWYQEYKDLKKFDMIVIDESSRFKSPKSKRFKILAKMIDLDHHRVYELSGTPAPNGWQDLWSQIFLLDKGKRLGTSYWKFLDQYFMSFGYKLYLKKQNRALIAGLLKDICIFVGTNLKELPPLKTDIIRLKFDEDQQKTFNQFKRDYIIDLGEEEVSVLSKQHLINKCLQLANGCAYYDKLGNYVAFDDKKLKFIEKYSKEHPEENILVFYPFVFDKERLMTLEGAELINNSKAKNKWNQGKIKIGVISPYSFQYGGNLQFGGYTIIWYGLLWGLENYLQSNKRIWRKGQLHEVKIMYLLMDNTWDEYVYKVLISKDIDQNDFLDRVKIGGDL